MHNSRRQSSGFLAADRRANSEQLVAAFRQGLKETGYLEGQDVHIAFRWAEGRYDRLAGLAAELVKTQVAVIASVGGSVTALAAKSVTQSIPIVAVTSDPIKHGLVASFDRPGGNITVISPSNTLLSAKKLELLRELVPAATIIGILANPKFPDSAAQLQDTEEAARTLGQQIHIFNASSERNIDAAFASLVDQRIGVARQRLMRPRSSARMTPPAISKKKAAAGEHGSLGTLTHHAARI